MKTEQYSSFVPQDALCGLEGALLRSSCPFPYFFLVAFEAGSIIRAFILLLLYPLIFLVKNLVSESVSIQILIFIAFSGLKASSIEGAARAVLPKFYVEDMRWDPYKVLVNCEKRYVITSSPRIMVEAFLKDFLDIEQVIGTEVHTTRRGYCTGLVMNRGVMLGEAKAKAATKLFYDCKPHLGIGTSEDKAFLDLCKESYTVTKSSMHAQLVPREHYLKPLIFHDGRIAVRPTPAMALTIFLWIPIGFFLVILRAAFVVMCPSIPLIIACLAALGVRLRYEGTRPDAARTPDTHGPDAGTEYADVAGNLFVCSHRTLLDPVVLSGMIFRRVTAVTYSISWLSELLSPIKTVRLTRCRSQDAKTMKNHLKKGDLIVCPEGTTCREPYLLRFSKLFVELAENVIPVAMSCEVQFFHGTSVRGWKALDPFFFALNPCPRYDVQFLEKIQLRDYLGRMSSFEIANMIQHRIAEALGFECTDFTRRDKYRILAGNEGVVVKQRIRSILHRDLSKMYSI